MIWTLKKWHHTWSHAMFLDSFTQHYVFECFHFVVSRCGSFISIVFTYQNKLSILLELDIWIASSFGLLPTNAAMKILVWRLWHTCAYISLENISRCGIAESQSMYIINNSTAKLYSKVIVPIDTLQAVIVNSSCSTCPPILGILKLFYFQVLWVCSNISFGL